MYSHPVQTFVFCFLTPGSQFPPDSISDKSILSDSSLTTKCPWKGTASYFNITVDGNVLKDAAWYYPEPKDGAKNIKDHIAFCKSELHPSSNIDMW